MRLNIQAADAATCPTFATNGTDLQYNPDFAATLTDPELLGVVAHEVIHCALGHPYRCAGRDIKEWNVAADYAANPLLIKAGFTLPAGSLIDPNYDGLSAEQIYSKRRRPDPKAPPQPEPPRRRPTSRTRTRTTSNPDPEPRTRTPRPIRTHPQTPTPRRTARHRPRTDQETARRAQRAVSPRRRPTPPRTTPAAPDRTA